MHHPRVPAVARRCPLSRRERSLAHFIFLFSFVDIQHRFLSPTECRILRFGNYHVELRTRSSRRRPISSEARVSFLDRMRVHRATWTRGSACHLCKYITPAVRPQVFPIAEYILYGSAAPSRAFDASRRTYGRAAPPGHAGRWWSSPWFSSAFNESNGRDGPIPVFFPLTTVSVMRARCNSHSTFFFRSRCSPLYLPRAPPLSRMRWISRSVHRGERIRRQRYGEVLRATTFDGGRKRGIRWTR